MRLVLCFVVAAVAVQGLSIRREAVDADMIEDDAEEFPYAAVQDELAGAPGSGDPDQHVSGAAHAPSDGETPVPDQPQGSPCDMQGNPEDVDKPKEEPLPPVDRSLVFEFECNLTTAWVHTSPANRKPFNLLVAQSEGNDRGGLAATSEFDVTDCKCKCSSANAECGLPGSWSYYSGVSRPEECAQMICHTNVFSECVFNGEIVAELNRLAGPAVAFESNVLRPRDDNVQPRPTPSPGVTPSTTPSPSPSPSRMMSYEEQVLQKALSIIGFVRTKACVAMAPSVVSEIIEDLEYARKPALPPVACAPTDARENSLVDVYNINNALAGYGEKSPLAADHTRHATLSMNSNVALLEMGTQSTSLDEDGFALAVMLFRLKLPFGMQCGEGVPAVAETLEFASTFNVTCAPSTPEGSEDDEAATMVVDSAEHMYPLVVSRLLKRMTGDEEKREDNEEWRMGLNGVDEDCNERKVDFSANDPNAEDTQGSVPGHRNELVNDVGDLLLPPFGAQHMSWSSRDDGKRLIPIA